MADWQAGDLALCVRGGYLRGPTSMRMSPLPVCGRIYRVAGLWWSPLYKEAFLVIEDGPDNCNIGPKWSAKRFRKVTPPAADEFDLEVIELMGDPGKVEREHARAHLAAMPPERRRQLDAEWGSDLLRSSPGDVK